MDFLEALTKRFGALDAKQEAVLIQILEESKAFILDYTNRDILIPKLEALQLEIAIAKYNKDGDEGISSRSQGGVSVSYEDLTDSMKSRLNNYRRLKVSTYATEQSGIV